MNLQAMYKLKGNSVLKTVLIYGLIFIAGTVVGIIINILADKKCEKSDDKRTLWYPIIDIASGFCFALIFYINGFNLISIIFSLLTFALMTLSIIDLRTYEIPVEYNYFIGVLGIVRLVYDYHNWYNYVIGLFAIFIPLMILYYASGGRAIGGGDVKLMASCGLLLGWKLIILAFFLGCILGSVIHVIRIKVSNEDHMLAMGPYLSLGVFISMLAGSRLIDWYLSLM